MDLRGRTINERRRARQCLDVASPSRARSTWKCATAMDTGRDRWRPATPRLCRWQADAGPTPCATGQVPSPRRRSWPQETRIRSRSRKRRSRSCDAATRGRADRARQGRRRHRRPHPQSRDRWPRRTDRRRARPSGRGTRRRIGSAPKTFARPRARSSRRWRSEPCVVEGWIRQNVEASVATHRGAGNGRQGSCPEMPRDMAQFRSARKWAWIGSLSSGDNNVLSSFVRA